MLAHSFLALAEKPATSVLDALPHLAGMLMVMITLFILWGVCVLTARLVAIFAPEPEVLPVAKPMVAASPGRAAEQATPPEIIAVIAAAVASVTGPSHRIVSIKRQSTTWEKVGRQSVLRSHQIR